MTKSHDGHFNPFFPQTIEKKLIAGYDTALEPMMRFLMNIEPAAMHPSDKKRQPKVLV